MTSKWKVAILTGAVIFSLAGTVMGSYSWFKSNTSMDMNGKIDGESAPAYFAYGSGTSSSPFGITTPRHLYNLAWLQYNGMFNEDKDNDRVIDKQYYFVVANKDSQGNYTPITINMANWELPPIGTETIPFLGNFDGKGSTIANLVVSNKSSLSHPSSIAYNEYPEIVGFFGVVGKLDSLPYSYTSAINSVTDIKIENITIQSKTEHTLAGLAAGYVNGDMSKVLVGGNATLDVNGEASTAAITDITSHVSEFGLVGYSTKTNRGGTYRQDVSAFYDSEDAAGSGDNWGGSIAMDDIFSRLSALKANYVQSNSSYAIERAKTYDSSGNLVSTEDVTIAGTTILEYNENAHKTATYDEKIGAIQMAEENGNSFHYLSGGHFTRRKTQYTHSGFPVTDGTNYVTVTGRDVAANNQIINTTDSNQALRWSYSNNHLVTKFNDTNYYLSRYNNSNDDLRLTNAVGSAVTLIKETSGSKSRYVYNNTHYLSCEGGSWKLVAIPTLRPRPTPVSQPTPVSEPAQPAQARMSEPTIWRPASDPGANSTYYYIYSGNNYFDNKPGNTTKSNTNSTNEVYWNFGSALGNGTVSGTIRNVNNNNYLHLTWETSFFGWIKHDYGVALKTSATGDNSSSNWNTTITNSASGGWTGTIRNADETNRYLTYNDGWKPNNNSATVNIYPVHQAYLDWQAYDANKALWDAYDAEYAIYQQYLNDKEVYDDYLADDAAWLEEEAAFPSLIAGTYKMVEQAIPDIDGPDSYTDGSAANNFMDYSGQDVTYFPLSAKADYTPADNNTGYIIGGSTYTSNQVRYGHGNVRLTNSYKLSTNITNYSKSTHRLSNVRTYNAQGSTTINDSSNSFEKYAASKESVETILKGKESSDKICGLHFMNADISTSNLVSAKYAQVNTSAYSNYQLPASSIDFNLKERGYINFFAGTFGQLSSESTTIIDAFFSLHFIERSGNTITNIYEIEQILSDGNQDHAFIYKLSNGKYTIPYSYNQYNQKVKYVVDTRAPLTSVYPNGEYTMVDSAPNTYSVVFDCAWIKINNDLDQKVMYYFEIPINCGEYCLGSVSNSHFGAYLVYLDIGAFARDDDAVHAYLVNTYANALPYPIGVDFAVTGAAAAVGGESMCVYVSSGVQGSVSFAVAPNQITVTDANNISTYSYKGSKYADANEDGKFIVSGDPPGELVTPTEGSYERLIHATIDATDGSSWRVDILDAVDANGNVTRTTYPLIKRGDTDMAVADIPASLYDVLDTKIRTLTSVVTLTRSAGTLEFISTAEYDEDTRKVVSISIDSQQLVGTTIAVTSIATGYTIKINGTTVTNNSHYPA